MNPHVALPATRKRRSVRKSQRSPKKKRRRQRRRKRKRRNVLRKPVPATVTMPIRMQSNQQKSRGRCSQRATPALIFVYLRQASSSLAPLLFYAVCLLVVVRSPCESGAHTRLANSAASLHTAQLPNRPPTERQSTRRLRVVEQPPTNNPAARLRF